MLFETVHRAVRSVCSRCKWLLFFTGGWLPTHFVLHALMHTGGKHVLLSTTSLEYLVVTQIRTKSCLLSIFSAV